MCLCWVWVEPRPECRRNQKHRFLGSGAHRKRNKMRKAFPQILLSLQSTGTNITSIASNAVQLLSGDFSEIHRLLLDTDEGLKNMQGLKMPVHVLCRRVRQETLPCHGFPCLFLSLFQPMFVLWGIWRIYKELCSKIRVSDWTLAAIKKSIYESLCYAIKKHWHMTPLIIWNCKATNKSCETNIVK